MTTIPKSKKKSTKYTLGTDTDSPISKSNVQDGVGIYQITELTYGAVSSDVIDFIDNHLYSNYMSHNDDYQNFGEPPICNVNPPKKQSYRTTQEIAAELEINHKPKAKSILGRLALCEKKKRLADVSRSKSRYKAKAKIKRKEELIRGKIKETSLGVKKKKINKVFTCIPTSQAKARALAARRREYESKRAMLLLALLDSGVPYTCCECKTTENITIDHKHPLSKGGSDELGNLRFLCGSCNSRKGSKTQA